MFFVLQIRIKDDHLQANKRFLEEQRTEQETELEEMKLLSDSLRSEQKKVQELRQHNERLLDEVKYLAINHIRRESIICIALRSRRIFPLCEV